MILLSAIFTASLNQKEIIIGVETLFLRLLSPDSSKNTHKKVCNFFLPMPTKRTNQQLILGITR